MFNTTKKQQKRIEQIHAEFDSAQERLLSQADKLLAELNIPTETSIEEKAERLKRLGFTQTNEVRVAEKLASNRSNVLSVQIKTKEQAELIRYYKQTYPFQKFLTEDELDRICTKYGLIHAPVANYIKDVPEKNLKEIEAAPVLKDGDARKDYYIVKFQQKLRGNQGDIRKVKREGVKVEDIHVARNSTTDYILKTAGLDVRGEWSAINRTVTHVTQSGLFIAAPASHFDLTGLEKSGKHGFKSMFTVEVKDPIVFRYCRGGIQVLSKWGLEAEDPALLNEINN